MTETTSNSGGKVSKTTKRTRNSPPEAPTPKPLQKLSKTNKLDNLIYNFLTPTTTRDESRAGRGGSGRGPVRSRNKGSVSSKSQKKKTVGQRRRRSISPKAGRSTIKPLSYSSRAKSAPRVLLTFTSSEEEENDSLKQSNNTVKRSNKATKSELSTLRKQLAQKWDKHQESEAEPKRKNGTNSNDGWDFDETSDDNKTQEVDHDTKPTRNGTENEISSTVSSIPSPSGLSKATSTTTTTLEFPKKISQNDSSSETSQSTELENQNTYKNHNSDDAKKDDRQSIQKLPEGNNWVTEACEVTNDCPSLAERARDLNKEHSSVQELYKQSEEDKSTSSNKDETDDTDSEDPDQDTDAKTTQSTTRTTIDNNTADTSQVQTLELLTIQESEDNQSRQSSNSQTTPKRSTTTSTNQHTAHVTGRTILNSTDLDNDAEDDINTQQSEDTLTGQRDQTQTVLPSWIRFRTIINMKQPPMDILAKKQRGEEIPPMYASNDARLLVTLKKFFEHIKSFDDTSMLIEWTSKNDDSGVEAILRPDSLPSAPSDTQKFFDGFKGKDEGPVYIRFRIITKFKPEEFKVNCKSWMKTNNCSLIKCPVQSEEAQDIGWLSYTSQFSDQDYIALQLSKVVGHEIGLKLAGIAPSAEADINWKSRTRALIVVTPREKALTAKNILLAKFREQKNILTGPPPANEIFKFSALLPLEQDMSKLPNCKTNFGLLLRRHQIYYRRIAAKMVTWIGVDLDKKLKTPKGTTTLRKMILNIYSTDPAKKNVRLIQSIDFVEDGSKVYFPDEKRTGAATSGHIFQYFKTLHDEATVMIEGLGVYLGSVYSPHVMNCSLTINHWQANIGWHWNTQKKVFVTPEETMVQELVKNDAYAGILQVEERLLLQDEKRKNKKENSSAQIAMEQQELDLIQILQNPDLDPITSLDQPVQQTVEEVEVVDQQSTTSSLTFNENSTNHNEEISTATVPTNKIPTASIASGSTAGTANTNTLRAALETGDTVEEKRAQLKRLTNMRMQRLIQREEQLMAELLQVENNQSQEEHKDEDTETRVQRADKQVSQLIEPINSGPRSPTERTLSDMSNPNNNNSKSEHEEPARGQNTGQQK